MMKHLVLTLALLPALSLAHNLSEQRQPVPVTIAEQGELQLRGDAIFYQRWQSQSLRGKVFLIQHIAGRSSAKVLNAPMIEAIKAAKLPADSYQTVTIVNASDAIWGTGRLVKSSVEESKRQFPWSQVIIDSNGVARNAWQLTKENSAIVLLDKQGQVLFAKDGQLSSAEIGKVMGLIQSHL